MHALHGMPCMAYSHAMCKAHVGMLTAAMLRMVVTWLTAMHGLTAMAAAGKAALSQLKTAVSQLC